MRKFLAAALLTAGLWAVPAPAQAMLAAGDAPPEVEGKEYVNSRKCDLKSLRGQVILYEIFRTW